MKLRNVFFLAITFFVVCYTCGGPPQRLSVKETIELREENNALKHERDSLKKLLDGQDITVVKKEQPPATVAPTAPVASTATAPSTAAVGDIRAGNHYFTLQWVSWITPGNAVIRPAGGEWFTIEGSQQNPKNKDHITIKGRIKQLNDMELLFVGDIVSVVAANNNGQPCVKNGTQIFRTNAKRKYWRMQDMKNCGAVVTDYVDIYF